MTQNRSPSARCLALAVSVALFAVFPAWAEPLQDVGKLMKQGQNAQALEQVDKYLAGKPKDAQGRFLKGLILTELNKPNEAIAVFQKLTEDYPELPEPYNNLAVIYAQQKQYEKAKQALEMAIRTHPSYATAHENLGDIYARLASQAYDKALQLDSSNTSAQTKLSMIRELMIVSARPAGRGGKIQIAAAAPAETKPVEAAPTEVKAAEPVKPAEAKPAESVIPAEVKPAEPVAKATNATNVTGDVAKAIEGWAAAWSKKDLKAYLAYYAKDFHTPGGEPRAAWEGERQRRIAKPGAIQISIENLRVTADGADRVTVKFRQYYRSAALKTGSNKVLVLVKREGRWLILQERIGN
jgi:tetratricopeptide (TPR) repeat protein